MIDIDPVHRLNAKEAKEKLGAIVSSMTPESLLIRPDDDQHGFTFNELRGLVGTPIKVE